MIITTAGKATSLLIRRAMNLAQTYHIPFKERQGLSIEEMKMIYQEDVLIVGKEQLVIAPKNSDTRLFFHPNLAMIRAKRVLKGETEPLIETAKLKKGMSFLDCTLGLASDSIIASLVVGSTGRVTGIEGNELLYLLVKEGLASHITGKLDIDQAMQRIQVVREDHLHYLQHAETNSFDIVYFDPMFQEGIEESNGINTIREQAITSDITAEIIEEAKRVAKERVVLKDHWKSKRFQELGFTQFKRKTSLFHYGTIEVR
ncbi:class I SAM-dependent methyltransferase [Ornithinibacillus sp. BX22]|uniref:Class I SAM-dependent methyltransferase n=2 Tax=Ornithinibacillus TaxID=484508 RepID=A0A923L462_9BACI|nr:MULTISPECIES: class I SAM-dependent methyltransferase [Ornithinibacillus]MBC5636076.1 class I SAM-dependent methyltransferase [Ornithinibacillus hominis]MBS3679916.1 class I SAM-dependent methyltransferase [Ornithinibacillus massiliensis]